MPLTISNLTAGTPITFNAQTSPQRMVFDSSTVAFRIVNNTTGIVMVQEENSDGFICQVDPGATAFGLMQNAILVEAQYPGPVTVTPYTWIPVSSGNANTWTAQNIFRSPAADTPGAIFQSSGTISTNPVGYGGSNVTAQFIASESSAFPYTLYDATGNAQGHVLAFRQSRGTYASRTATQLNDILGQLDWGGHNATSVVNGRARIVAFANQTWTGASNGTSIEFYVTPSGQTASTLGLRLSSGTLLSGHNAEFFGTLFLKNNTGINFESVAAVSESVLSITSANNVQLVSPTASGNIVITNRATNGQIQLTAGTSTGVITLATGGATRLTLASTGFATFARGMVSGVSTLTDAANIALDASLGNHFRVTLAGNRTLNAPTNPTDGQRIAIEVIQDATGGRTLTLTTGALGFAFGTDIPSITLTTTANLRDFIECVYNSTAQRWYVIRFVKGY